MACYMMKARTVKNAWYSFTISDVPTAINSKHFALLAKPNSPVLKINDIRRGDAETGLFEGDVITAENDSWLVCYERGFYAINTDYVVRHLYTFKEFEVQGDYKDVKFPVPINFRNKQLFKYKDKIFRLDDIVGVYGDKILLRCISEPVRPEDIQQECCISYNNSRVYLGDYVGDEVCELHGGRVTVKTENGYLDLSTGGILNGYNPSDFN